MGGWLAGGAVYNGTDIFTLQELLTVGNINRVWETSKLTKHFHALKILLCCIAFFIRSPVYILVYSPGFHRVLLIGCLLHYVDVRFIYVTFDVDLMRPFFCYSTVV